MGTNNYKDGCKGCDLSRKRDEVAYDGTMRRDAREVDPLLP